MMHDSSYFWLKILPEGITSGSVGDGAFHDLFADGGGDGGLVISNSEIF